MATYYFSSSIGNDSNSSTQAQNSSTPWQSLTKLNSFFSSLQAGDTVAFKCGDTFYGSIIVNKSGNISSPITLTSYGSGSQPIITGFSPVTSWTNISGNIWESTNAVKTSTTILNAVNSNGGNLLPVGRYPKATDSNSGYLTIQSHSGEGAGAVVTSSSISGLPSYVNGQVAIRKTHWIIDKYTLSAQTSTTFTLGSFIMPQHPISDVYTIQNNWGFFFQNSQNACTVQNEWYYNTSTRKMGIYSSSNPSSLNIQIASIDTTVTTNGYSYIKLQGLHITGANQTAINVSGSAGIVVDGCTIDNIGINGVDGYSPSLTITNSTFSYILNNGIYPNSADSSIITGNTLNQIATVAGMSECSDGQAQAILYVGANSTIQNNVISNVGYQGIRFSRGNVLVKNNYIYNVCLNKDDGGAIYGGARDFSGTVIDGNIIINSKGAPDGTDGSNNGQGIYIDDGGSNVTIINNSISGCGNSGLFTNGGINLSYSGNTSYDNRNQFATDNFTGTPSGLSLSNNILISKTSTERCLYANSSVSSSYTNTDNNYYARPIDDNNVFSISGTDYNLSGWRTYSGQDANSHKSPKTISNTNELLFLYNETLTDKNINLGGASYIDVMGNSYSGTITLPSFTSLVLIQTGMAPVTKPSSQVLFIG